ncbi:hypothetical protein FRB94_004806 [Tulasnella sp. JGI-2019a]|nr:hypothetical protein FRB94_004806 [Tulasnella sp. JGI-2019a]
MTLETRVHQAFDTLKLWFEPQDGITDQYCVCTLRRTAFGIPDPPIVTFTSSNNLLPVPSERFIRLHTTCAKVANLSGAGEYVDCMLSDMEEMDVLRNDGTSADVLSFALAQIPTFDACGFAEHLSTKLFARYFIIIKGSLLPVIVNDDCRLRLLKS